MLADSTNVETEGSTGSERVRWARRSTASSPNPKGACWWPAFASHIHRIQQAVQIAHLHGRKFAVSGRSMVKNVNIARNLGYLQVPDDAQIKLTEIDDYRPDEVLILTTGSQGEPLSALSRMAWDDHPQVELRPGDTVVIAARPVPGNKISVMDTVNRLLRSGARVIYGAASGVHVSGHAAREDQRMLLNLLSPRFFVPAHGEYRHQYLHAELAREAGVPDENIFLLDNGDVLEITADSAAVTGKVPAGMMFVDGLQIGGAEHVVLRERQQLRRRHPYRGGDGERPDRRDASPRPSSWRAASSTTRSTSRICWPRPATTLCARLRRAHRRARHRSATAARGHPRHARPVHLQVAPSASRSSCRSCRGPIDAGL